MTTARRSSRAVWIRLALPAYWLALFAATHYPRVPIPGEIPQSDKVIHVTAFALLAVLFWAFLAAGPRPLAARSVWLAAAVLIPYATVDEVSQQLVGRHTDLADWVANVAGIAGALAVLELRRRISQRRAEAAP